MADAISVCNRYRSPRHFTVDSLPAVGGKTLVSQRPNEHSGDPMTSVAVSGDECRASHAAPVPQRSQTTQPLSYRGWRKSGSISELPDQDSNLDKQNQNLLCYRYTIGQFKAGGSVSDAFVQSQVLVTDRILVLPAGAVASRRRTSWPFVRRALLFQHSPICDVPVYTVRGPK